MIYKVTYTGQKRTQITNTLITDDSSDECDIRPSSPLLNLIPLNSNQIMRILIIITGISDW